MLYLALHEHQLGASRLHVHSTCGSSRRLGSLRRLDLYVCWINIARVIECIPIRPLGPHIYSASGSSRSLGRFLMYEGGVHGYSTSGSLHSLGRPLLCGGGTHDSRTLGSLCSLGKSLRYGGRMHVKLTSGSPCLSGPIIVTARGSPSRELFLHIYWVLTLATLAILAHRSVLRDHNVLRLG